ncbi:hypothetical protein, partial [Microcoleus sp. herbarium12]|uniref:hypothetical protein n=1 Tax=Microcoleus sp. herbarium12 TaxID=3055437 RepID=UPI002FD6B379
MRSCFAPTDIFALHQMHPDFSPHPRHLTYIPNDRTNLINWFQGFAFTWELEAEPPDLRYQAQPGNE